MGGIQFDMYIVMMESLNCLPIEKCNPEAVCLPRGMVAISSLLLRNLWHSTQPSS